MNMKRAHKRRPRSRKGDPNRQRIVDAARVHFFSNGFRSVTMDDLAEELGISKKTLYAHFPGKLIIEILLAMVQSIMNPPKMEELGMMPKEGFAGILKIVLEGALTSKGRKA